MGVSSVRLLWGIITFSTEEQPDGCHAGPGRARYAWSRCFDHAFTAAAFFERLDAWCWPSSSVTTRRSSATLHAWATQPPGWWGGSPLNTSEIWPRPSSRVCCLNAVSHRLACSRTAGLCFCTLR